MFLSTTEEILHGVKQAPAFKFLLWDTSYRFAIPITEAVEEPVAFFPRVGLRSPFVKHHVMPF